MAMQRIISNQNELPEAAKELLNFAGEERVFLFYGEMGAGKTTFIKALCRALGVEDPVSSPTFSIINEYIANGQSMYHFDFYRIKTENEALDMGYEDYLFSGNYCFIEWPERISNLLPQKCIEISLQQTTGDERELRANLTS